MDATLHLLGLTIDQQASSSALPDVHADAIHARFTELNPEAGLVIVNTCARLEFYVEADAHHSERVREAMTDVVGPRPAITTMTYELHGDAVVGHLLRLASGLESPILGDTQILAQLRRAEARARHHDACSSMLGEAMRQAIGHGMTVRRETGISAGRADIGGAVSRAIADHGQTFAPVVIIGAGDAAERTLAAFDHAPRSVGIINRNRTRATDLAQRFGAWVLDACELGAWPNAVYVITTPTVGPELIDHLDTARLVVDLVPGGTGNYANVKLEDLADWSDARRLAAVDSVADRCDDALAEWQAWTSRQPFEAAVGSIYQDLDQLVDDLEVGDAAIAVRSVVRRWLHPHISALRDAVTPVAPRPSAVQESV